MGLGVEGGGRGVEGLLYFNFIFQNLGGAGKSKLEQNIIDFRLFDIVLRQMEASQDKENT